jgi:putative transferase (TIGR04331 family)
VKKRFLVTSAIEETIPFNKPILFLGEWCKPFSKKNNLEKLDSIVLSYHWDDRTKLFKDNLYLKEFYEKLIIELTNHLNQIHGTSHKEKYWRIFIGPWLGCFIQNIFNKWSCIQSAVNKFDLIGTYVQSIREDLIIPSTMRHFSNLIRGEEWNHFIFSHILKNYTKVECFNQKSKFNGIQEKSVQEFEINRIIKKKILDYLNLIFTPFQKKNDAFFINSYLSKKSQIILSLKLLQAPIHRTDNYLDDFEIKLDQEKRNWKLEGTSQNEFEIFARSIISKQIPIVYLEGFNFLSKKVSSLSWPSQPKFIYTGNSYMGDDLFKLYAAQKTENGCPLVIAQHGGGFGTYLFAFTEEHGFEISDLFLSWGWTDKSNQKVKSVGIIKEKKSLSTRYKDKDKALLVVGNGPNHFYHIWSAPISSNQWLKYFKDQCDFINSLDLHIQDVLIIRLKNMTKGYEPSYNRWVSKFPKMTIDEGKSKIDNQIIKSKIYIGTYNASTSVECFSLGIPVVIYWTPNFWEVKDSAKKYFDKLKKVGVFHETPESAARHINLIWPDVNSWWKSYSVQEAVNLFKNNYCYESPKVLDNIISAINNTIKKKK